MKKIKRTIASILSILLLLLCTACTTGQNVPKKSQKWVLVEEKLVYVDYDGNENVDSIQKYQYDSYGRRILPEEYVDVQYDERGNIISFFSTDMYGKETQTKYEYDENNNLTKCINISSDATSETTYQYNGHNDKIYSETNRSYTSFLGKGESQEIFKYTPYYENNLCVSSEEIKIYNDDTYCALYKYEYDENDNMIADYRYVIVAEPGESSYTTDDGQYIGEYHEKIEHIEYKGQCYELSSIGYYTYELITIEETSTKENSEQVDSNEDEMKMEEKNTSKKSFFQKEETTTDPYNGLPAPIELKLVKSNGKKAMKNDTSYEMDYSMHLIEDYHGLKYLVLTCSATSKYSDRKVNGPDFFPVTITKSNMERTFDLDDEVEQAYDEIIFSGYLDTTLYPGEVEKASYIYDFYGDKENITVVLQPSLHGNVISGSNNYIHGIYTGNYLFSENKWDEYIFLEFAF